MATNILIYRSSWRDAKGFVGRVVHHITGDSSADTFLADVNNVAQTLQAAIGGLTNAHFAGDSGLSGFQSTQSLGYGDNLEYPAEWMKAVFQFSTDDGTISRFKIPAPELDIFDTDGVTVLNDGTQAQVVAYINAVKNAIGTAFCSTQGGRPFTHFEGGLLRFGKQPRRFNERIKSSHLVAGEGE